MATALAQPDSYTAPKRMGRPPIPKEIFADQVLKRVANGETLASICSEPGMPSFDTVWRWVRDDPNFSEMSLRAKETGTHHMADDCIRIADDKTLDPQDRRIRIDTRLRLIGQWNRAIYGAHTKTEHSGKVDVDVTDHSERLQELARVMRQDKRLAPPIEGEVIRRDAKPKPIGDSRVTRVEDSPEDISDLI